MKNAGPVSAPESDSRVDADVIVVGAGWSGLAAAVELARSGVKPLVLESARQIGGRGRSLRVAGLTINNGQHVLLGTYRSTLSMLAAVGVDERQALARVPLGISLKSALDAETHIQTRHLPAPLHLLWALITASGFGVSERLTTLRLLLRARLDRFDVRPDVALAYYLRRCGQTANVTRALWQPLCRAALGSSIERASTRLFLHVLRDLFFGRRLHSDLLIPTLPLIDCFPRPAMDFIESHGGSVRVATRVNAIHVSNDTQVTGVQLRDQVLTAKHVVLATPPDVTANLLREHTLTQSIAERVGSIEMNPVCTLYLQYPDTIRLKREFVGILDGAIHWLFDCGRHTGKPGLIAAVIVGAGAHMHASESALTALMIADVARLYPHWPAPLSTHLVKEKHATFAATPENEALRPGATTRISGLWLAGDYTATGYPSTLEGAVRSGIHSARRILRDMRRTQEQP